MSSTGGGHRPGASAPWRSSDGRWRLKVKDPRDGKWRTLTSVDLPTLLANADQRLDAAPTDDGTSTVAALLAGWVDRQAKRGRAEGTLAGYRHRFALLPSWFMATVADEVSPLVAQRAVDEVAATPVVRRDGRSRPRSTTSVGKVRQNLSAAWKWGVGMEVIERNVFEFVTVAPDDTAEVEPPTAEQVAALVEYLRSPTINRGTEQVGKPRFKHWSLVAFLPLTGLRIGEASGLRWGDVEQRPDGRTVITIARQVTEVEGRLLERDPKSNSGRRIVLTDAAATVLADHRRATAEQRHIPSSDDLVWATENGTPVGASNVRGAVRRACKALGMPYIKPHHMRHHSASVAYAAGVPARAIMAMHGWSSPAMLLRYSHVDDAMLDDVAARLDAHRARLRSTGTEGREPHVPPGPFG